jgi:raffinose/stachyose/melibiose transport system permease protein
LKKITFITLLYQAFRLDSSDFSSRIQVSFLNNVPDELLEASRIDGANSWQRFIHIKFPLIAPAFTISLFLTLSNAFKVYDQNMALTGGGPFSSTEMATMNIYNSAFKLNEMGYAQAKAVVFLIIIATISLIQIYFTRKREVDL